MKIIVVILRIFIVLLGMLGLLAGLNSLIFPGVGILIATTGFVLALWLTTMRLTTPENSATINTYIKRAALLAACGLLLAHFAAKLGVII